MLGGGPAGLGVVALLGVIASFISSGTIEPLFALASLLLLGVGGYLLHLLWPSFQSIDVSDAGIRLTYRKEEIQLGWDQIRFLEVTEPSEGESQQHLVFIATGTDVGHLLDDVTVARFDELIQCLHSQANSRSIRWSVRNGAIA